MGCEHCKRLIHLYREAINASETAFEQYRGAVGTDAAMAAQAVDLTRRKRNEAIDEFLEHIRKGHSTKNL